MNGVGRTVMQLLCWRGLQRWTLGIGTSMTIFGMAALANGRHEALRHLWVVVGIVGVTVSMIGPFILGGALFRALSAPRTVSLIPRGRVQLLLGALGTQLLMALFTAWALSRLLPYASAAGAPPPGMFVGAFAIAFGVASVQFFLFYVACAYRVGIAVLTLVYLVLPKLLQFAFPRGHIHDLFTTATVSYVVPAITVLGWLAFAVAYLLARHIGAPRWSAVIGSIATGAAARSPAGPSFAPESAGRAAPRYGRLTYQRRTAVQTFLTQAFLLRAVISWRSVALSVLIFGVPAGVLFGFLIPLLARGSVSEELFWLAILPASSAPSLGGAVSGMTRRARSLWLQGGLDRAELFRQVELQSWRTMLVTTGTMTVAAAIALSFRDITTTVSAARIAWVLMAPFVISTSMIYAALLYVRGRRFAEILVLGGIALLWLLGMVAVAQDAWGTMPQSLLAAQIIAVPVLRSVALRRWKNIDWLIHRPLRSSPRGSG